jgi:hypothetical protein
MPDRGMGYALLPLRRPSQGCYIRRQMTTKKQTLTALMALILCAGVLSAQLCDLSCASQVVPGSVSADIPANSPKAGHCHQSNPEPETKNQSEPLPQQRDHSSDCQSHSYAEVTKPPVASSFTTAHQPFHVDSVLPFALGSFPFDQRAQLNAPDQPFRSPPGHAAFSVLRI